jgi:hypothetical protein
MLDLEKCADSRANLLEQVITLSPGELIQRAIAVRMGCNDRFSDQVRAARKLLDEATFVAKAAKAQGDPTDRKVLEHVMKHKRNNRVLITDTREMFGGHALDTGINYKLQLGDPRTMLLSGAQVTPDLAPRRGLVLPSARAGAKRPRR